MIIYNVTVNIEDDAHDAWLKFMLETHITEVMKTGFFTEYKLAKLLTRQPDETGTTYVIQYFAATMADYEKYRDEHAPRLQADTQKHFGGKFVAFRSLMEEV